MGEGESLGEGDRVREREFGRGRESVGEGKGECGRVWLRGRE